MKRVITFLVFITHCFCLQAREAHSWWRENITTIASVTALVSGTITGLALFHWKQQNAPKVKTKKVVSPNERANSEPDIVLASGKKMYDDHMKLKNSTVEREVTRLRLLKLQCAPILEPVLQKFQNAMRGHEGLIPPCSFCQEESRNRAIHGVQKHRKKACQMFSNALQEMNTVFKTKKAKQNAKTISRKTASKSNSFFERKIPEICAISAATFFASLLGIMYGNSSKK